MSPPTPAQTGAASSHAKGLALSMATALVLGVVTLASDEAFLVDYLGVSVHHDAFETLPWISEARAMERMAAAKAKEEDGHAGGEGDDVEGLIMVHDLLLPVGELRRMHSGGDVFGGDAYGDFTDRFEEGHSGGGCGGESSYYMRTLAELAVARVRRANDTRAASCDWLDADGDGGDEVGGEEEGSRMPGEVDEEGLGEGGEAEIQRRRWSSRRALLSLW